MVLPALLASVTLLNHRLIPVIDVSRNPECRSSALKLLCTHVIVFQVKLVKLNITLKLSMNALQDKRQTSLNCRVLLVSRLR